MTITENLLADFLAQGEAAAELKVCRRTLDRSRRPASKDKCERTKSEFPMKTLATYRRRK
jgi:hypothetical protein